jgi:Uma2 family endonuclease
MEPIQTDRKLTFEEYEKLELESELRYEFDAGQVYAMAGGTVNHSLIGGNIFGDLKGQLKKSNCKVFAGNMKVSAVHELSYRYPDVLVACHPFDLRGTNQLIRQPRLIVEVLSKSTEHIDRGIKWQRYRRIQSLIYYLLVDQYKVTVELFSRIEETDEWILSTYENLDDVIVLPRMNTELALSTIYEDIEFGGEEEEEES